MVAGKDGSGGRYGGAALLRVLGRCFTEREEGADQVRSWASKWGFALPCLALLLLRLHRIAFERENKKEGGSTLLGLCSLSAPLSFQPQALRIFVLMSTVLCVHRRLRSQILRQLTRWKPRGVQQSVIGTGEYLKIWILTSAGLMGGSQLPASASEGFVMVGFPLRQG
jgi:hypothetical protein